MEFRDDAFDPQCTHVIYVLLIQLGQGFVESLMTVVVATFTIIVYTIIKKCDTSKSIIYITRL